METTINYDKKITLNGYEVNARKWKAKEKFKFKEIINKDDNKELVKILVYDCLDKEVAFSEDEYKYVLAQIRSHSLGETIKLEFNCESCDTRFVNEINLNDVLKPEYEAIKPIITNKHVIKIGEIKNKDFYKKVISQAPDELDFYLRIDTINDEECYSIEEVIKYFSEMDIDEFENIINQWEKIKFKLNDNYSIKCTKCEASTNYQWDEIPGFFPNSWYN